MYKLWSNSINAYVERHNVEILVYTNICSYYALIKLGGTKKCITQVNGNAFTIIFIL